MLLEKLDIVNHVKQNNKKNFLKVKSITLNSVWCLRTLLVMERVGKV